MAVKLQNKYTYQLYFKSLEKQNQLRAFAVIVYIQKHITGKKKNLMKKVEN